MDSKRRQFQKKMQGLEKEADILFLQETHVTKEVFDKIDMRWKADGRAVWSTEGSARGVATILFNSNIQLIKIVTVSDRMIHLQVELEGRTLSLVNCYFPAKGSERAEFLEQLEIGLDENLILGGDFNFTEDPKDSSNGAHSKRHSNLLKACLEKNGSGITDAVTHLDSVPQFTFRHVSNGYAGRLDRFYISTSLKTWLTSLSTEPGWYWREGNETHNMSDHWPLCITLEMKIAQAQRAYWKLNSSLMDENSDPLVKSIVEAAELAENLSAVEKLQVVIKETAKTFKSLGAKKAKEEREALKELSRGVALAKAQNDLAKVEELEMAIETLKRPKELFKLRTLGLELDQFDEFPSKYLSNRLKARQDDSIITSLLDAGGTEKSEMTDILEIAAQYYENLYNLGDSSRRKRHRFLSKLKRRISKKDLLALSAPFAPEETLKAIQSSKGGSSPGIDGIPYDLFKRYRVLLALPLTNAFNEILADPSKLPESWKHGIIKLLYKKGDRRNIGNWRPITLLNTSFKLLTAMIDRRLAPIVAKIVGPHQKGFVKGRFILDHVMSVKTVRENNGDGDGLIAFLDFEKAFDRVNHNLILETFEKLGMTGIPLQLIKVLLGGTSQIYIQGSFSRTFRVTNGARQGDPFSPKIFILVIETLAINVLRNKNSKGLHVSMRVVIKILLFADDVCLLPADLDSFRASMHETRKYEAANLSKVNLQKSLAIPLRQDETLGAIEGIPMIRPGQMEKYLGAEFYSDPTLNGIPNCIEKIEKVLIKAKNLQLSMLGRANVVKHYALPSLHYCTSIDSPSKLELNRVQNVINWFLFHRGVPFRRDISYSNKMGKERMAASVEKGGLGVIPLATFSTAQKCHWILRALQGKVTDGWAHALTELLETIAEPGTLIVPPGLIRRVPAAIKDDKRSTLVTMLTHWAKLKRSFNIADNTKHVGTLTMKASIGNVLKVNRRDVAGGEEEEAGKTLSVQLMQWRSSKRKSELREADPVPFNIERSHVVPVRVRRREGSLRYLGPTDNDRLLEDCLLPNGSRLQRAVFSDIKSSLSADKLIPTEKQSEWIRKFPGLEKNFEKLKTSKLRMRVKSHAFARYNNLLPRRREGDCPWCGTRESSDHILFQCQNLRSQAQVLIRGIRFALKQRISLDNFLMVLSDSEQMRLYQMAFLYGHWLIRCKLIHGEFIRDKELQDMVKSEVGRYILRAYKNKEKMEPFNPLMDSFDPSTLTLTVLDLFERQ